MFTSVYFANFCFSSFTIRSANSVILFISHTKDEDGNLVIDSEHAKVIKRIYREYLESYSMDKIVAVLEADCILTGAGKPRWHTSTNNKILHNEKYIGNALLQKTYTTDFLNKTRVKNTGIVPQYYVNDSFCASSNCVNAIYILLRQELFCIIWR